MAEKYNWPLDTKTFLAYCRNMNNKELIAWLKENSSGDYRPAFEAAERLRSMKEALECLALDLRNAANGYGIGNFDTMANLAESCLD